MATATQSSAEGRVAGRAFVRWLDARLTTDHGVLEVAVDRVLRAQELQHLVLLDRSPCWCW